MTRQSDKTPLGHIYISPRAIATIAHRAVLRSYGVVGLAPKNVVQGLAHAIAHDPLQGVEVHYQDEAIEIDLYVVVQYGTRIAAVASSAANLVRYEVEKATGLPVRAVNVHVRGLKINGEAQEEG